MKAIETRWKGYRFRSRLEARWAVYFEALGLQWEYEPEGFDLGHGILYLPDFWLPQVKMWAEVKPKEPDEDEIRKARLLAKQSRHPVIFLVGTPAPVTYGLVRGFQCMDEPPMDDLVLDTDYLHENRFYTSTGNDPGTPLDQVRSEVPWTVQRAVEAARSARFEHGESPAIERGRFDDDGQAAIEREYARVVMAPDGSKGGALHVAASNLARLAAHTKLDVGDAKIFLYGAAIRAGIDEEEAKRGIDAGWASGEQGAQKMTHRPSLAHH